MTGNPSATTDPPPLPAIASDASVRGLDLLIGVPIIWGIEFVLGMIMVVGLLVLHGMPLQPEAHPLALVATTLTAGLGTAVVTWFLVCWKYKKSFCEGFRIMPVSNRTLLISVLIGLVYAVIGMVVSSHFSTGKSMMESLVKTPAGMAGFILLAIALPPVEELYYHGFLFPALRKSWGKVAAILVVIAWFSAAHVMQLIEDPIGIPVIAVAVTIWTLQRQLTDSLTAPLVSHLTYNTLLVVVCSLASLGQPHARPPALEKPAPTPALERQVMDLLNAGEQRKAESRLRRHLMFHRSDQRALFLKACCQRSRFWTSRADATFESVVNIDPDTVAGQCSRLVLALDARKNVERRLEELRALADEHPDDVMVRWMIAVQCRAYDRNAEGAEHYEKVLRRWDTGPAMVHQTYANLLDNLKRYEEALVQRRLAVKQEPEGYTYQGLGNTLAALDRFDEANRAFAKAVELDPDEAGSWASWGLSLVREKKPAEAIVKCQKAVALDPESVYALTQWGEALELQEKHLEAIAIDRRILAIEPTNSYALRSISWNQGQIVKKNVENPPPSPFKTPTNGPYRTDRLQPPATTNGLYILL